MKKTFKDLKLSSSVYGVDGSKMQRLSISILGGNDRIKIYNTNGTILYPFKKNDIKQDSISFEPNSYYSKIHFNIEDALTHVKRNIINSMASKAEHIERITKEIIELKEKYNEY